MLKIKYIPSFKNGQPYLFITSTAEGFVNAAHFFRHKHPTVLNESLITEVDETNGLARESLSLTLAECSALADIFERISTSRKPAHDYFDIKALPNTEIIVSYMEYDGLV